MTFRTQAIATLKSLREDGVTLQTKLNASNEALHAELVRIETELQTQADSIEDELIRTVGPTLTKADCVPTAKEPTPTAPPCDSSARPLEPSKGAIVPMHDLRASRGYMRGLEGVARGTLYTLVFLGVWLYYQGQSLGSTVAGQFAKDVARQLWDWARLRRCIDGRYRSTLFEKAFCLS